MGGAKICVMGHAVSAELKPRVQQGPALADFIRAMGGELEIAAPFSAGEGADSSIPGCAGAGRAGVRRGGRRRRRRRTGVLD
jgi:hypothetical protein